MIFGCALCADLAFGRCSADARASATAGADCAGCDGCCASVCCLAAQAWNCPKRASDESSVCSIGLGPVASATVATSSCARVLRAGLDVAAADHAFDEPSSAA